MLDSSSWTVFCRRRAARLGKSTRSISWSWLKHEKMIVSLPLAGSTCFWRHCAQTSFIMHCIGELIDARDADVIGLQMGRQHAMARRLHRRHHPILLGDR